MKAKKIIKSICQNTEGKDRSLPNSIDLFNSKNISNLF